MQIETEADAEKAGLKHIGAEAQIATLEAEQIKKIAAIKKKYGDKIKKHKKDNGELLGSLAEFYWAHPDDRDAGTKQLTLNSIRLSERETKKYKWPTGDNALSLIKKIKKLGLPFVRTKEELNKQKITDEASEDQLKVMGIKTEKEITVYVEAL